MSVDIINYIISGSGGGEIDSSQRPDSAKHTGTGPFDPVMNVEYGLIIRRAIESDRPDPQDVHNARKALESGELDSPESIQSAVENILKFGI